MVLEINEVAASCITHVLSVVQAVTRMLCEAE